MEDVTASGVALHKALRGVGPDGLCSPRRRIQFNSRHEGLHVDDDVGLGGYKCDEGLNVDDDRNPPGPSVRR
jgi:hypothetical protein